MTNNRKVSVAILSRNRPEDLECCLNSLEKQSVPIYETIIIDNGTDEITPQISNSYQLKLNITYLRVKQGNGLGILRNLAWSSATGDIVAYIDNDAEASMNWLESITDAFDSNPNAAAVTGPTISTGEQEMLTLYDNAKHSLLLRFISRIYEQTLFDNKLFAIGKYFDWGGYSIGGSLPSATKTLPIPVDILSTCNVGVKRSALEAVNGFDEGFIRMHEDGDLGLRLRSRNYQIIFKPSASVLHHVSKKQGTRSASRDFGRDFAYFYAKHVRPSNKSSFVRSILNVLFFLSYWTYKSIRDGDLGYLRAFSGMIDGFGTYIRRYKILR